MDQGSRRHERHDTGFDPTRTSAAPTEGALKAGFSPDAP